MPPQAIGDAVSDPNWNNPLSNKEELLLKVIHDFDVASVAQIQNDARVNFGYATIRSLLRSLECKGFVRHRTEGRSHLYYASISRNEACRAALKRFVVQNCDGSLDQAWKALIEITHASGDRESIEGRLTAALLALFPKKRDEQSSRHHFSAAKRPPQKFK